MNNKNTHKSDVLYTDQIKRNLDFGTSGLWIMGCEMRSILMSIFTDFFAFKSNLSNVTEIHVTHGLGNITQVWI